MRRALILTGLLVACGALGGCHHGLRAAPCTAGEPYTRAQSAPPVRTAEGLAAPNTHNALKIPETTAPVRQRSSADGCLDQPPSFYPGRPKPGAKAAPHSATPAATGPVAVPPPAPEPAPPPATPPG